MQFIFGLLKLDYGKHRKIVKFPTDLSFISFPLRNTLQSNVSSSALKIQKKMQKMTQKTKPKLGSNLCVFISFLDIFFAFFSKYLRLKIKKYYANIFSSENFHWKKNLVKILQFFHISQTSFKGPKMSGNCHFSHFFAFYFKLYGLTMKYYSLKYFSV